MNASASAALPLVRGARGTQAAALQLAAAGIGRPIGSVGAAALGEASLSAAGPLAVGNMARQLASISTGEQSSRKTHGGLWTPHHWVWWTAAAGLAGFAMAALSPNASAHNNQQQQGAETQPSIGASDSSSHADTGKLMAWLQSRGADLGKVDIRTSEVGP